MATQPRNVAAMLHAVATDFVVEERPIPTPEPHEVVLHNSYIALNPIDWKRQSWGFLINSYPTILGADVSGTIVSVGSAVTAFKAGDRVVGMGSAFATGSLNQAAYQTYTAVLETSVSKLPENITLEQGATLATAPGTAAAGLFHVLGLPRPGDETGPSTSPSSILIWGGACTVGNMAIQLAHLTGLTVYTTASEKHHSKLRSIGADVVFDYHSDTVVKDILAAAQKAGHEITYALDAVSVPGSLTKALEVISKGTGGPKKLAHTTPWPQDLSRPPSSVQETHIHGEDLWTHLQDLSVWLYHENLPKWLEQGLIRPPEFRTIKGGVSELQNALNLLKNGVSGEKILVEV